MAKTIKDIMDELYGMMHGAWSVPLGRDKCVVEREKVLALLDDLRTTIPLDMKTAKEIVQNRQEVLLQAKKEADAYKRQAEERAQVILSDGELELAAKHKAREATTAAETKARDIRKSANEYCEELLAKTEASVQRSVNEMRTARQEIVPGRRSGG